MAVISTLDLIGTSDESWEDAAISAVSEAVKTIHGIEFVHVLERSAVVDAGGAVEWRARVSVRFHDGDEGDGYR